MTLAGINIPQGKGKGLLFLCAFTLLLMYSEPMNWFFGDKFKCNAPPCHHLNTQGLKESQGYLVNTKGCKIMGMDPFHPSVLKYLKKKEEWKCKTPPVQLIKQRLSLDESRGEVGSWWSKGTQCCYRRVARVQQDPLNYDGEADNSITIGKECKKIGSQGVLVNEQYVKIECENEVKVKTYQDFMPLVLPPNILSNQTKEKVKFWEAEESKPPNILVIGLDSISRMHMIRSLPKTRQFLLSNDFIEMKGYNKIGENTFPNIMGGFAGMRTNNYSTCWKSRSTKMDDCPFIWKKFSSELKYMTALLEDAPGVAIFNYDKTGFVAPPTDYYLRPIMVANHKHHNWKRYSSIVSCLGPFTPTQLIINYVSDFVGVMNSTFPYFLFSWFTNIGHDDFNTLKSSDGELMTFLNKTMGSDGDNTVMVFMSDHGYRFGSFRETFLGYYEESLPFFFIRLPPALKQTHPHWYDNLKENSQRLTSPFDLYSTLIDLYTLAKEFQNTSQVSLVKSSSSFFDLSPENRTCESSWIPQKYCACGATPQLVGSSVMSAQLGDFVVKEMNGYVRKEVESGICAPLTFSKLLYGRELSSGEVWNNLGRMIPYTDYLLAILTLPLEAKFEAKIRVFQNSSQVILGDVSRINSYEGLSDCITDYRLKNYCICTSVLPKATTGRHKLKSSKHKPTPSSYEGPVRL